MNLEYIADKILLFMLISIALMVISIALMGWFIVLIEIIKYFIKYIISM